MAQKKPNFEPIKLKYLVLSTKNKKASHQSGKRLCCRGRARTFKGQLAITQSSVVDPGRLLLDGSMLRLSRDPHLRDKEARLPKISSPHNFSFKISKFDGRFSSVTIGASNITLFNFGFYFFNRTILN